MKVVMHIPTEPYGYMEVEIEGTPEDIVRQYFLIKNTWKKVEVEELEKSKLEDDPFKVIK